MATITQADLVLDELKAIELRTGRRAACAMAANFDANTSANNEAEAEALGAYNVAMRAALAAADVLGVDSSVVDFFGGLKAIVIEGDNERAELERRRVERVLDGRRIVEERQAEANVRRIEAMFSGGAR